MITQEYALEHFEYRDGELYFRSRNGHPIHYKPLGRFHNGYKRFEHKFEGKRVNWLVHRIVFLMHHGYMPPRLDHIDNDRSNNRIENLRPATASQNAYNRGFRSDNKTSYKGVWYSADRNIWLVNLSKEGQHVFTSKHNCPIEAAKFYDVAARFFFGEYALTNFDLEGNRNELPSFKKQDSP